MLRKTSAVIALLLVLLPIGGMSYTGGANLGAAADQAAPHVSPGAGGAIPTPAAMVVVCLGGVGVLARQFMPHGRPAASP